MSTRFDLYVTRRSWLHELDPRTKLAFVGDIEARGPNQVRDCLTQYHRLGELFGAYPDGFRRVGSRHQDAGASHCSNGDGKVPYHHVDRRPTSASGLRWALMKRVTKGSLGRLTNSCTVPC